MASQLYVAYRFTVQGDGHFPVDMLRSDRCIPLTQDDITAAFIVRDMREVKLIAYTMKGNKPEPTIGRWRSFGWTVVPGSVKLLPV